MHHGDPEAPRKLVLLPRRLPPPERQQVVSSASRSMGGWRGRLAPPTPAAGSLQNEGCLWFTATDNPHLWSDSAVFKNGSFTSENLAGCWWERAVHLSEPIFLVGRPELNTQDGNTVHQPEVLLTEDNLASCSAHQPTKSSHRVCQCGVSTRRDCEDFRTAGTSLLWKVLELLQ